MDLEMKSNN